MNALSDNKHYAREGQNTEPSKSFRFVLCLAESCSAFRFFHRKLKLKWNINVNFSPFSFFFARAKLRQPVKIKTRSERAQLMISWQKCARCETFVFVVRNNTTIISRTRNSCRRFDGAPLFHFCLYVYVSAKFCWKFEMMNSVQRNSHMRALQDYCE